MNWHTISIPLIIFGVIVYHFSQKSIPENAHPLVAIAVMYLIAFGVCVATLLISGEYRRGQELFRNQNWVPVVLLGLTAIAIELGYLYAYRTGWKFSTTAITTSSITATVVLVIGLLWFREQLTALHLIGVFLCIAGVVCINAR